MTINVDFLFQWAPGWTNYESVISVLQSDKRFCCRLILLPFHHSGVIDHENREAKNFLEQREIDYIWHEDYDFSKKRPDLVFIQNPYDFTRPERFSCLELKRGNIKFAYIPYGLDVGDGDQNLTYQYNMDCHNLASWIFVRSSQHKHLFKKYCSAGNKNVHVTGHPKFDTYRNYQNMCLERKALHTPVLLWTPHFYEEGRKGWSTFKVYCMAMIYMAINYPIKLIIRPHPLFMGRLKIFNGEAVEMFKTLINYAKTYENITFDMNPSYQDSFLKADALLADAGSFLLEFLPSKKPILYLTHPECFGLNESAKFIYESHYVASDEQDIDDFVKMLLVNEDPKYYLRMQALTENIFIPEESVGDEIRKVLLSQVKK